jgi:hypothetical protein
MRKLSWAVAVAVFLLFFDVYSFRLGIRPELWHDDYEYTYPSYSLAERGDLGSPLLGTGLDIHKRTYSLIVYYYASVHAVLIRLFGDGAESIPLANTFHFALLAGAAAFLLLRRGALVGLFVFLYALVRDEPMIEAARHGRPEMTAGFYLTLAVFALWLLARGEPAHLSGALRDGGTAHGCHAVAHGDGVLHDRARRRVRAAARAPSARARRGRRPATFPRDSARLPLLLPDGRPLPGQPPRTARSGARGRGDRQAAAAAATR